MNFLVDLASGVNKCKVMAINKMFENEIETTKRSDERTWVGEI